jgi:hypothetical protein
MMFKNSKSLFSYSILIQMLFSFPAFGGGNDAKYWHEPSYAAQNWVPDSSPQQSENLRSLAGPSEPPHFQENSASSEVPSVEGPNRCKIIFQVLEVYKDQLSKEEYLRAKLTLQTIQTFHKFMRLNHREFQQREAMWGPLQQTREIPPGLVQSEVEKRERELFHHMQVADEFGVYEGTDDAMVCFFRDSFRDGAFLRDVSNWIKDWHFRFQAEREAMQVNTLSLNCDDAICFEIESLFRHQMSFEPVFEKLGITRDDVEELRPSNAATTVEIWKLIGGKVGADGIPVTLERIRELVNMIQPQKPNRLK